MSRFLILALLLSRPALPSACAPVVHDPITAGDLAALAPVFGQINPETPITAAPVEGARRVFRPLELTSLAKGFGLMPGAVGEICFEWPLEALDRTRLLAAMQAVLPNARIEIVETSLHPAPLGRIEFRREDLGAPALPNNPTPVVWRGNVIYGADHRYEIWARVRVTAQISRVIAAQPIREGAPITAGQLRVESTEAFPAAGDIASRVDQVAGRIALRNIVAGAEIHLSQLQQPPDVKRGDAVTVEVLSNSARLAFTGKSESNGRKGDLISIRNLRSNRIFQARVEGKDRALVDIRIPDDLNALQRN